MNLEQNPAEEESLPAPMSKRQLFSGIGIRNVDDRIKLMYGEKYGSTLQANAVKEQKSSLRYH